MIFKELIIQNFGIYKGKHSVDLEVTPDKPVVLFGALNGGGKTTFLDAIQLVLYGKYAKCSNRANQAYGSFLASCKNRFASAEEESTLSLAFFHHSDNAIRRFDIERSWQVKGLEAKDKVKVYCDFQYDEHLSQYWDEFVNEFIPQNLSDLFLFDGEKIENLAHPQRSSELVRTGIESLLGLDLLSQLQIDLANLDKKRRVSNVDQSVLAKVEACEEELGQHNVVLSDLKKDIAELEQQGSDTNIAINKARQAVRNAGAHLIEQRDELKFELGAVETKLKLNKAEQVKLAAGVGPLALVKDLIEQTKQQIKLETAAKEAKLLDQAITAYDQQILNTLKASSVSELALSQVEKTMAKMSAQRQQLANVECYLNTDLSIFNGLEERIADEDKQKQKLKREEQHLLEKQALLQKQLEAIPAYDKVQHLLADLAEQEATFKNLQVRLKQKQQSLEQAQARGAVLSQRYTNLLAQQNKDTFEQKRIVEVGQHIKKLKTTMTGFAEQLISENIERLQSLVKEKFDALGRKSQLISDLTICPASFTITLYDVTGAALEPAKLSAGERQLLAIAILWGLAEASGKELPTVIDTPLGRLDGKHRSNLINNYFPKAGSQVILLSTDEEIIGNYYQQLKPYVCREYQISYNEQDKTSNFNPGYF
ncbi:DNA sulfur modification protein DndD [Rheinheimera mesophila]|uniref:DNA sulfur modification protein DndD n=1 Tax=Rheinheimera mesophila TaxID=1547515 RepID=A0A3P3QJK4_9GAMM|nr:DNA sulfur modification protein DndD [Rheinheimera mesophila]KKL02484.1 ABC transporter ATP-binding protein [Rheinheimera mesophila]RRJ21331.1 DNA sulfur modification protein DndD [Rheinheimera mesophila]